MLSTNPALGVPSAPCVPWALRIAAKRPATQCEIKPVWSHGAVIFLLAVPLLLAGCSFGGLSSQQIARNETIQCENYGFQPQTTAFAQCFERVDQNRIDRANANANARRAWSEQYLASHQLPIYQPDPFHMGQPR